MEGLNTQNSLSGPTAGTAARNRLSHIEPGDPTCFSRFLELLSEAMRRGMTDAWQFCIIKDGKMYSGAHGLGTPTSPMTTRSLFKVWCGSKPVLGWYLSELNEGEILNLSDTLAEHLDWVRDSPAGRYSLIELLAHLTDLTGVDHGTIMFAPVKNRRSLVVESVRAEENRSFGYSQYVAWSLLSEVIGLLLGESAEDLLRGHLASHGFYDVFFGRSEADYEQVRDRIGVYLTTSTRRPWLHDRARKFWVFDTDVALGGYASMEGLSRWYYAIGPLMSARIRELGPLEPRYDEVLERLSAFRLGFMTRLQDNGFTAAISDSAIGHLGWWGTSFAWFDIEQDLSVAILLSGVPEDTGELIAHWRVAAINALAKDVASLSA